ncbi:MAG: RNA polymerase sigma factor [Caulobacteraceae bacterium]
MPAALEYEALNDAELASRASARDGQALRLITARNNQRLFRAAWSVLKNRADAEEAVQDAYVKALSGAAPFAGQSSLSTWLTRIVINEALARKRAALRRKRSLDKADVAQLEEYRSFMSAPFRSPEFQIAHAELAKALEAAVARLPDDFRIVLVLRDIEGMSVDDTAEALGVAPATIKTRHLRARRRLRRDLDPDFRAVFAETLRFAGADCERITARALTALCQT